MCFPPYARCESSLILIDFVNNIGRGATLVTTYWVDCCAADHGFDPISSDRCIKRALAGSLERWFCALSGLATDLSSTMTTRGLPPLNSFSRFPHPSSQHTLSISFSAANVWFSLALDGGGLQGRRTTAGSGGPVLFWGLLVLDQHTTMQLQQHQEHQNQQQQHHNPGTCK